MENCHLPEERPTSTCSLCGTVFHGRSHEKDLQVHLKRTSCGKVCVETKDGAEGADGLDAAGEQLVLRWLLLFIWVEKLRMLPSIS